MPASDQDRVFRDPVHGLIEFVGENRKLAPILETRCFQRLRRLRQMGFAGLVYPGAEHSRFGHALGTYHIARRVARKLEIDTPTTLHLLVAALLHDIGHGPFSHIWEQVLDGNNHETWGARLVLEDDELATTLDALSPGLPATIASFWNRQYRPTYARKLVSSQLDVDRLDYLLRDGHYSGAGYATFDLEWILHALRIESVHDSSDPEDLVIDYRRGMYAVEQYLFARTYMYAQVYHHKAVRAAEHLFLKLLTRFGELAREGREPDHLIPVADHARGQPLGIDAYLWLDDVTLQAAIDSWAGLNPSQPAASDPILRDLAIRFARRRLFKTIDLGDEPGVAEEIRAAMHKLAEDRFGDAGRYYYEFDTARQITYKASVDGELHVVGHPRYGTITLGQLLEDLPLGRPVAAVRLVCAPELVDAVRPLAERAAQVRAR